MVFPVPGRARYGVASISVVLQTLSTDPALALEGFELGALLGEGGVWSGAAARAANLMV